MRTFVAIEISEEARSEIASLQDRLREANAEISWTRSENIHLSLKFLGEVSDRLLVDLASACTAAAAKFPSFKLSLDGAGAFPDFRQPRVLWVGLGGELPVLVQLQDNLDEELSKIGFERNKKPFRAHLTIGRVRSGRNLRALTSLAKNISLARIEFDARQLVLMRSELHPAGSKYTRLAEAALLK